MLAPTPLLRPGPLDIGGLFAGAFAVLRARFGLFVLIALIPSLVSTAVVAVVAVVAIPVIGGAGPSGPGAVPLIGLGVAFLAALVFAALVQVKTYGLLTLAAYEVAQGQRPDLRGLLTRNAGFLRRLAPVILIAVAAIGLGYGLLIGLFVGGVALASRPGDDAIAAIFGTIALVFLLALLLIPLWWYLGTRLLYTIQATALERLDGIAALKRSWSLTRGAFWRTFGYNLVASLAVGAVSYGVSSVAQVFALPLSARADQVQSPAEALRLLTAMIPVLGLSLLLQLVVQVVSVPFLQAYVTCMYLDQVRRSELPPAAAYGYGGPQYFTDPGAGHPPQPGYPPQAGWPQQPGYPPQVGWPQQGPYPTQQGPYPPQQGQWPGPQQPPR